MLKGYYMTYRGHNYKLNAIAWLSNEKGVRIWENNMPIANQDKYKKECLALELLINGVLFNNFQNIIIVSSSLAVHNQIIGKGRRNSYIAKHCDKIKQVISKIDTVGFLYEKAS